jgi:chorismate mutase
LIGLAAAVVVVRNLLVAAAAVVENLHSLDFVPLVDPWNGSVPNSLDRC